MPVRKCLFYIALMLAPPLDAEEPAFPDDNLEERIAKVNEGRLHFLPPPPAPGVHHHYNEISVSEQSLRDGWVELKQCHSHLDPVGATQIVYNPARTRALSVLSSKNLGESWVEGPSVQLRGIAADAEICIQAQSRALHKLTENRYRLRNGPYMRRFLDGYFPLRVTLDIRYPGDLLELTGYSPASQPGLEIDRKAGSVRLEGWFEGRLFTQFDFHRRENPPVMPGEPRAQSKVR